MLKKTPSFKAAARGEFKHHARSTAKIVLANAMNDLIKPLAAFLMIMIRQIRAITISITKLTIISFVLPFSPKGQLKICFLSYNYTIFFGICQ